jgi:hypothetical protein
MQSTKTFLGSNKLLCGEWKYQYEPLQHHLCMHFYERNKIQALMTSTDHSSCTVIFKFT